MIVACPFQTGSTTGAAPGDLTSSTKAQITREPGHGMFENPEAVPALCLRQN
jgi:hypothetical protein